MHSIHFVAALLLITVADRADAAVGKRFALLIGVKSYQHPKLERLRFTERDVSDLGRTLAAHGFATTVLTTTAGKLDPSKSPTSSNIDAAVRRLIASAGKDDLILIGLAGHGVQFKISREQFFCPVDADPETKKNLLSIAKLTRDLQESRAGAKILLVDACRMDPDASRPWDGVDGDSYKFPADADRFMAAFSAGTGERSYETPEADGGHGVFFHCVMMGLRHSLSVDDPATWESLSRHLILQTPLDVKYWVGEDHAQTVRIFNNPSQKPLVLIPSRNYGVRDGGRFFTPKAVADADARLAEVKKKFGVAFRIETISLPEAERAKLQNATKSDRAKHFKTLATKRFNDLAIGERGGVVLIVRSPSQVQAHFGKEAATKYFNQENGSKFVSKIAKDLTASKGKPGDDALDAMLATLEDCAEVFPQNER